MPEFRLESDYQATGDQPRAIEGIVRGVESGKAAQTLLGVTGSGKTFTMAKVIEKLRRPSLILAPNKTLAGQLYSEFRQYFPDNAVGYFVSYYDYYQPEAYVVSSDTYIAKDAAINDQIDRMRHQATHDLLTRRDVVIIASVSCIYGIGSPASYSSMSVTVSKGAEMDRDQLLRRLVMMQYVRNDFAPRRGTFRVRGDVVEIFPAWAEDAVLRVELWGSEIERMAEIDAVSGEIQAEPDEVVIHPASHYVTPKEMLDRALVTIEDEKAQCVDGFKAKGKLLEAQRLEMRSNLDLELLREIGTCSGIENYSRHLDGRQPGEPPATLIDYFPDDFLLFVDESHVTVPQVGGMFRGDRARKLSLVEHGFRLPSALDNRPLTFEEFEKKRRQVIYVSATPGDAEVAQSGGVDAELVIRPTGLIDPKVEVRPATSQVDDLLGEIRIATAAGGRVLVTCLTKRMAENLTEYLRELDIRVRYLHSDIDTLERHAIIRSLRLGDFDVLVGINLLREGLDLPEVTLVGILDADKEGFLRSKRSLIQTIGRAARNVDGRVVLYADHMTDSMAGAIAETDRRRKLQEDYNREHGITPQTVRSKIAELLDTVFEKDYVTVEIDADDDASILQAGPEKVQKVSAELRERMLALSKEQRYEEAAELRDRIRRLEGKFITKA